MQHINWDEIPDEEGSQPARNDREPVPEGDYEVKVADVYVTESNGVKPESWGILLEITQGQYKGRSFFDNIYFGSAKSPDAAKKNLQHCRLVFKRLGIEVSGQMVVVPNSLIGRTALVHAEIDVYQGKQKNRVGFGGWLKRPESSLLKEEVPF